MKIAIPIAADNGLESNISEHFGHAPFFAFVVAEQDKIISCEIEANPFEAHQPGDIPDYIKSRGANVIIARGMGSRARQYFQSLEIEPFTGASGTVKEIVQSYLAGQLENKDYEPQDRDHHHH